MASKKRSGKKAASRKQTPLRDKGKTVAFTGKPKAKTHKLRKKAKPGRPFSDNPRNYTLSGVRLTEGEMVALQTAADKSDTLTFAGWIRKVLFKAAKYAPED